MKKYAFNEITLMQYILAIHGMQVGIGVLQLPRLLAEKAGTDGWISLVIGWLVSIIVSLVIIRIMKYYPEGTILELLSHYFGRWAGKLGALVFGAYFFFFFFIVIVRSVLFLKLWILPQTSDALIMILFLIPKLLIVPGGVRIMGRYAELVFYMALWLPFFYLLPLSVSHHWLHLLPVMKEGWKTILETSLTTVLSFLGFETAFFLYPFLQKKQFASKGIIVANILTVIVYLGVTLVCFVFFSPDEIARYNEPTLSVLKVTEFRFVERMEIVFLAFYLFILSTTAMPMMYFTIFCSNWLFGTKAFRGHFLVVAAVVLAYTLFFVPTFPQSDKSQKIFGNIALYLCFVLPFALWFLLWMKTRSARRKLA
ncbi:GerAB/ArcD/ProY family transporter [Paenibacillus oleatilyticus]|uniref:GerAB/ArcD/ProY family transporter n=1 Tax=Paenibacillus oleatilyticus TaxID=2594886 RepID=UPI001C1F4FE0|nr:endospore germination permease [Paenibacillus oleatilyticus]MBU7314501.1 endospore germination permease [Paenibacillus oleatilyticus]